MSVQRNRRRSSAMVVCVGTALLLAAGCSADPDEPATAGLALASMATGANATAAMAEANGTRKLASGTTLATPIPELSELGFNSAPTYRPTTDITTAKVAALATALGVEQAPVEQAGGWVAEVPATDPTQVRRLYVLKDDEGTWFFGAGTQCDLTQGPGNAGACTSSAVAVAPDAATAEPDAPRASTNCDGSTLESVIRREAQKVFDAVGTTQAAAGTATDTCEFTYTEPLVVDGLPVSGADTTVTIARSDRTGARATSASGTLATWATDRTFPLADAATGWERVQMLPQPAMAELCQVPPDGTGCLSTQQVMTGAEVGLMRDTDLSDNSVLLVPAWLFTISSTLVDPDGGPSPKPNEPITSVIAVTAIADSALVRPPVETVTSDPGQGSGGGSSPGSPGSSGGIATAVPPDGGPAPVGVPERMASQDAPPPTPLDPAQD